MSSTAKVAITGGAGFVGSALARRLLEADTIVLDGTEQQLAQIILLDLFPPADDLAADSRVRVLAGDLADALPEMGEVDAIFHLAGVVSSAAEDDFDLGMRTNLDGLRLILESSRRQSSSPVLVFTSSLAVYGSDPAIGALELVDDDTLPRPQSSYGIQKFIGEQLVADYARKGFIRGRSVRLMTVSVRPGKPNAAASSFMSGIIREPLAGERAVCPVPPDMPIALSSPSKTLDGILRAAAVDGTVWGSCTAMNLPALTTTPREMVEAMDRVVGAGTSDLIDWQIDPAIVAIVGSWPSRFVTPRADAMGLTAETSFDQVIEQYLLGSELAATSSRR